MSNFTQEQITAAKAAKTPEELIALAKEQGIDITYEQAANIVTPLGELADEELENVSGGLCKDDRGREIVTLATRCVHGVHGRTYIAYLMTWGYGVVLCGDANGGCKNCPYLSYEKGMWYCNYNTTNG